MKRTAVSQNRISVWLGILTALFCVLFFAFTFVRTAHAEGEGEEPNGEEETQDDVKQGLVEEDGFIRFYQEDGTLFTDGYKAVTIDGKRQYYYFLENGNAFTGGYIHFEQGGKAYTFYFQEDGTAFTEGYKEITLNGKVCYFYFLANGQGFNTGYKTVMIDGRKYYFYFDEMGEAITDTR